jgi:hypothetical protein
MDLYGNLWAINNTPDRIRARQLKRARRKALVHDRIGDAIGDTRCMQAAVQWNMHSRDPGDAVGVPIGSQHPNQAAILAVRDALSEYRLPLSYETRPVGFVRESGHGAHAMTDGTIVVEVAFRSLSGIDHTVDVPVIVTASRVLEPVCLIDQGIVKAMAQETFDEILDERTFHAAVPDRRTMFSPPPEERRPPVQMPLVRPGMFGFGPTNRLMTAGFVQSAMRGQYVADMPSFSTARVAMEEDAPDHRQWAERPVPGIRAGDKVTLRQGIDVVGRDGQRWHLTAGTEGQVQRSMCGTDDCYYVFFPEMGWSAKINGEYLK